MALFDDPIGIIERSVNNGRHGVLMLVLLANASIYTGHLHVYHASFAQIFISSAIHTMIISKMFLTENILKPKV